LFGQTAGTPLSFEVASVKPASAPIATKDAYTEGYNAGMRAALASQGLRIVGQRVTVTDNSLKDLIRLAYQVKDYQISAPAWMAAEKYEIAAVMPAGATRSQAPEMLRTLLEERFHLKLHRETRKLAAYALVAAKGGPKLTPSAVPANGRGGSAFAGTNNGHLLAKASTLAAFADLAHQSGGPPGNRWHRAHGIVRFRSDLRARTECHIRRLGPRVGDGPAGRSWIETGEA
jgi:uncharacterized protein (TIGR03435 family)